MRILSRSQDNLPFRAGIYGSMSKVQRSIPQGLQTQHSMSQMYQKRKDCYQKQDDHSLGTSRTLYRNDKDEHFQFNFNELLRWRLNYICTNT